MKKSKRFYLTSVFTLLSMICTTEAQAFDPDEDPPLEYAYNHTIDFQLGTGRNLKSYSQLPDEGIGLFGHDTWGFDFSLRYTQFFSRHWGAYFQLGILSLGTTPFQMEDPLSQRFNHGGKEVRIFDDFFGCWGGRDCGSFYDRFMLGAAYRYDIGRWSFRPHLGLGIMRQYDSGAYYYIVDTNTQDSYEEVDLRSTNAKGQYKTVPAFAYSPSIQICFSTSSHFFLSAEMEWTGTIGHLYQRSITKQYRAKEPQDWLPESDGYFWIKGDREYIKKTDGRLTRVQMGNFLQFRIGFGWNIGWNRNEKRSKK